jgi:hypothetical protein
MGLRQGQREELNKLAGEVVHQVWEVVSKRYGPLPPIVREGLNADFQFLAFLKTAEPKVGWTDPKDATDSIKEAISQALREKGADVQDADITALINPKIKEFLDKVFERARRFGIEIPPSYHRLYCNLDIHR